MKNEILDHLDLTSRKITRSCDIKAFFEVVLCKTEVLIAKVVGISTNGVTIMTGSKNELISRFKNVIQFSRLHSNSKDCSFTHNG